MNDPLLDPNAGQQCRLCLIWVSESESSERLQPIFAHDGAEDESLTVKIRECLGIFVSSVDTIRRVCQNCVQTVGLIDEFRILCSQTDEFYESIRVRSEDTGKWNRYQNHVNELRKLVQEQQALVNEAVFDTKLNECEPTEEELSNAFRPVIIKTELTLDDEDTAEEEKLQVSECTVDVKSETAQDEEPVSVDVEYFDSDDDSMNANDEDVVEKDVTNKTQLRINIAREIQARLPSLMSGELKLKRLLLTIGRQLELRLADMKHHWYAMKTYYRDTRKRCAKGSPTAFERCRECPLFALMDQLVSELSGEEPWKESEFDPSAYHNEVKISLDVKIAIAEEMRKNPELWDTSLASSGHTMESLWKNMAENLDMRETALRAHWRRLRQVYRQYRIRLAKGVKQKNMPGTKYAKLIGILDDMLVGRVQYNTAGILITKEKFTILSKEERKKLKEKAKESQEKKRDEPKYPFSQTEDKLALAEAFYTFPIIWSKKHPDYNNILLRDQAWDQMAALFDMTRRDMKREWPRLRDLFRSRYLRLLKGQLDSDDYIVNEPLYKVLEKMFKPYMRVGARGALDESKKKEKADKSGEEDKGENTSEKTRECDSEARFGKKDKLKLAQICLGHEILWNNEHPDYTVIDKKDAVWDQIGAQFRMSRGGIKQEWGRLRDLYRGRYLRHLKGERDSDHRSVNDQLYKLLNTMIGKTMQVGVRGGAQDSIQHVQLREDDQKSKMQEKLRLAEEVSKYEVIWNFRHPDFKKREKRAIVWAEIAKSLGTDRQSLQLEWHRMRCAHRARKIRALRGEIDTHVTSSDPLQVLMDKLTELSSQPDAIDDSDGSDDLSGPVVEQRSRSTSEIRKSKRRFTGKRNYDDIGCIAVEKNGITRYEKICELCGKQIERSYFEYHMNAHYGLQPYACSFEGCDRKYSNKITRDRHEVIVHGEDGYHFNCDQCGEKFKQKARYDYHYAMKHKSQEIPCELCGKVLQHKERLRDHMRVHTNSYVCNVCNKVLQTKYSLGVHMRTHTKEKPYPCEICGQCFMLKVQMKTHLSKIHGILLEELQATTSSSP